MIDREKVIKAVKEAFDLVHSDFIGTDDFNETEWKQNKADALALLKEQEAVKPIRICTNYEQHWKCGKCNAVISLQDKFCHECGSPVLWKGR